MISFVKNDAPFVKLKPLNYEFGSSEIRRTFDIVATGEKTTKKDYTFIIPPLNCTVNNLSSIKVMDLVESTYSSLIVKSTQSIDFRAVRLPCEHSDRQSFCRWCLTVSLLLYKHRKQTQVCQYDTFFMHVSPYLC